MPIFVEIMYKKNYNSVYCLVYNIIHNKNNTNGRRGTAISTIYNEILHTQNDIYSAFDWRARFEIYIYMYFMHLVWMKFPSPFSF